MKEKIIFLAQTYAPNPSECTYWIDLKEDPTGAIIKVWNGATWKPISGDTEVVAMLQEEIKKKATKATTLSGYGIQDAYTKDQVDAKVASVYRVKGSVADFDSLPSTASVGDVYNLDDTGANYVCITASPAKWDKLSETVDLTGCVASDVVSNVVYMTQAQYEALSVKDSKTLYLIY